jgi:3-oxoacyl-[acyl-carrier protein] reductase
MKKIIVVSGGSKGIGKAVVCKLLDQDNTVITFSREETNFIQEMKKKERDRQSLFWESIDIRSHEHVREYILTMYRKLGRIDCLINNTGVNLDRLLPLTSDNELEKVININLTSTLYLTRTVSRIMLSQNFGTIINISSIIGSRGYKGTSVYGATKAALIGMTKCLARELGKKNIRVNTILPGFIETDMTNAMESRQRKQIIRRTPLGRLGKVSDIIGPVDFLMSDASDFVTGQSLIVDGGLTC